MNVIICDQDKSFVSYLYKLLLSYPLVGKIETEIYYSSDLMLLHFVPNKYDVIFMEIDLDNRDGIQVAEAIRIMDKTCKIVYVTNNLKKCCDAYRVKAFRYIIKSYELQKMEEGILEVLDRMKEKKMVTITAGYQGVKKKIPVDKIIYIKSDQREVIVCTKSITLQYYETMQNLIEELEGVYFVQPHRSYLVNLKYVKGVIGEYIILKDNDKKIPVSKARNQQVIESFVDYLFRMNEIE